MAGKAKEFLVSTADFALFYDNVLAATGTTNLDSSIEVSMEEQNVNAGKGNKLVYSYKYGRQLTISLDAADWRLEYIAMQVGTDISEGLTDAYRIAKCITINDGIGVLPEVPVGDVAVETPDGNITVVTTTGTTLDLTDIAFVVNGVIYGGDASTAEPYTGTVNVTYMYNKQGKTLVIDAESSPKVFKLVLDADKHNNKIGKVGSVQIEVPSYQPSGNFTISFTPDGATSTSIAGKALAVEGDTCENGGSVYAYIREFNDATTLSAVNDIAATPAVVNIGVGDKKTISIIGLKGGLYSSIAIDNADATFSTGDAGIATVSASGEIEGVGAGTVNIKVEYAGHTDVVEVTVA